MNFQDVFTVFLMAAWPIIECRGAIPYGILVGIDPATTFAASFLGNVVPVPFLLLFLHRLERWVMGMSEVNLLRRAYIKYVDRLRGRAKSTIDRYGFLGLILFVAVPLPFTGAWTSCLLSYLFGMEIKRSLAAIATGVLGACIIVMAVMLAFGFIFP